VAAIICVGPGHEWCAPDAIKSAQDQRPRFDQIVVCLDSSCPAGWTTQLTEDAKPPITLVRSPAPPGKSTTFNHALSFVKTDWAIHFGADDVLEQFAVADFAVLLRREAGAHLYYSDIYVVQGRDLSGKKTLRAPMPTFSRPVLRKTRLINQSMFFSVERAKAIGGYSEEFNWSGQGYDFWLRYALNPAIRVVKALRPFACGRKGRGVHSLRDAGLKYRKAVAKIHERLASGDYERWVTQ
jgi:glycosyltransferase involved in cell wall biosynthesis